MTTPNIVAVDANDHLTGKAMTRVSKRNAEAIAEHLNMLQHTDDWAADVVMLNPDIFGAIKDGVIVVVNPRSLIYTASTKTSQLPLGLRATGTTPTAALEALATRLDEHIAECRQALITICKGVTS